MSDANLGLTGATLGPSALSFSSTPVVAAHERIQFSSENPDGRVFSGFASEPAPAPQHQAALSDVSGSLEAAMALMAQPEKMQEGQPGDHPRGGKSTLPSGGANGTVSSAQRAGEERDEVSMQQATMLFDALPRGASDLAAVPGSVEYRQLGIARLCDNGALDYAKVLGLAVEVDLSTVGPKPP